MLTWKELSYGLPCRVDEEKAWEKVRAMQRVFDLFERQGESK